ncbi:gephyrin-like molybdotransferase Glp [Idiomarina sp.]|uniref:molybdopterin molybdotransferase MoeA n=1 Tax=Idiomarina sp. TaxID=1874361 RepID=UPI001DB710DA|nr:gephyrin-like molybdotransferase Glp [Idiomarina sp.]MCJ8317266.1 molybdopterin molybdotransferase MoeA [Idiomarina sp.]NQZ16880.1 molybdopterin molybdotransferase MoeA [Idiomarina sp.]
MSQPLKPVTEALAEMLAAVEITKEKEVIELNDAHGRILSRPVNSTLDVPGYDNSAMDGYAVRCKEAQSGTRLIIAGVASAGHPFNDKVEAGQCVRIMTGAPVPEGFDAVVIQENTEAADNSCVVINKAPSKGENIRLRGSDMSVGEEVIAEGTKLSSIDIGLLASLGVAEVSVFKKPKVAVFSTGDELVAPGGKLAEGQIYDSNRYLLKAMLSNLPVDIVDLGCLKDDLDALQKALSEAAKNCDAIITSGGVSVGDADFTKDALEQLGEVNFWKVAMKPGKPFAFGKLGNAWFFGLPGNPVAATVTMDQLAQPVLRHLSGEKHFKPLALNAVASAPLKKRPGRADYQRGFYEQNAQGELTVSSAGSQSSAVLSTVKKANCLILLEQEQGAVEQGDTVKVLPFSRLFD